MKTKNWLLIGALTGAGFYARHQYKKYKKYITTLKLGITVLKLDVESSSSTVLIENLTTAIVPDNYRIESIKLINETKEIAINTNPKVGSLIEQNPKNPITFQILNNATIPEIEASSIVVTFNWVGFIRPILYNTKEVVNVDEPTQKKELELIAKTGTTDNSCCCH